MLKAFKINCDKFTEKKNGLTYLSWANAWSEFKQTYPEATYVIKKDENNLPIFGNEHMGYMVYTEVTVGEITYEMWLPVLDYRNKAIMKPNMFDINKSIMRCLTKNLAMFGLGINIYMGEDFPEEKEDRKEKAIAAILKRGTSFTEDQLRKMGINELKEVYKDGR